MVHAKWGVLLAAAVSVAVTAPLAAEVKTEDVVYRDGDVELEGYLAYDDSLKDKRPGVVVFHEWYGINDYVKGRVRQLAELGYVAFAGDIYGRGQRATTAEQAGKLAGKFRTDRDLLRRRAGLALEQLRKSPRVDGAKVAAIGYCFGGTAALELARGGADLQGVVSFHGGLGTPKPADANSIRCRVLVLHGADDPHVPAQEVAAFQKEMRDARVDWQMNLYGGAVHSFTNPASGSDPSKGVAYNEKADKRSWADMLQFFTRTIGGPANPPGKADRPGEPAR